MFLCLLPANCEIIFIYIFIYIITVIIVNSMQFNSVQFLFINMPSQQPD